MDRKKRARHNPYAENHSYINNSTSNPPPPDYDEYYMFTVLYVLFVPVAITIIMGFNGIFGYTPLFVAFMMFLYAYLCIAKFKLNKPDSLFELYLPILAYLGW